jgi:glutamyl-tRNA synthetase
MNNIRLRFAPSPTGPLHMGGVRTVLFNYLFVKKFNGKLILRIEDTDQTRYVPGAEEYIMNSLDWCGIKFDEGIREGGNYGPYRQSERKEIYKKYAIQLIEQGNAYYAFDTPEELENMRKVLEEQKSSVQHYSFVTRGSMKNTYTLSSEEVNRRLENKEPYVIRFNIPENKIVEMNDLIRGKVVVNSSTLDDKVIFKSADGLPTYHLANIVDDHLMEISHVIRGEEWLPSLPLHYLLYESFGWEKPQFAHLPLILKPNGKGKLSKRDGDAGGFPVFPTDWIDPETKEKSAGYKETGYFPEAFINMLALLGWNPGTEQEIFTVNELIDVFSIEKVGKSGSKFDPDKAKWFNEQYMHVQPDEKLAGLFLKVLENKGIKTSYEYVTKVVKLLKDRAVFIADFWTMGSYFFIPPTEFDDKAIKKFWKPETAEFMKEVKNILTNIEVFNCENTENEIKKWIEVKELGFGKVMNPLRLLLVGAAQGPHLFDIVEMLGKEEVLKRIDLGLSKIN